MRLELKDLQSDYNFSREWTKTMYPRHLLRVTLTRGNVIRYWNTEVGMSALKNPGGVTVEVLAFAEEADA